MNNETIQWSLDQAERFCTQALINNRVTQETASCVARALVGSQRDGQDGHGLARVPSYAAQSLKGKVDGNAEVTVEYLTPTICQVNAHSGFAYPAIDKAISCLATMAGEFGIAAAAVIHSHHFGQAGAHCERLAELGKIGLLFGNSPAAIAAWGGKSAMIGTNPIAFAAPLTDADPLVIDFALSKVARGKVLAAQEAGGQIPDDWALDKHGNPTTNPNAAMEGTMLAIGGPKGTALAMMVEVMSAVLSGGSLGRDASSLFNDVGPPPNLAQTLICIDPYLIGGVDFDTRMSRLMKLYQQEPNVRLPGQMRISNRLRAQRDGMAINKSLAGKIISLADNSGK